MVFLSMYDLLVDTRKQQKSKILPSFILLMNTFVVNSQTNLFWWYFKISENVWTHAAQEEKHLLIKPDTET